MASARILIVDDEHLARERLQRMLVDEADYEVVAEAAHGRAGVEQAALHKPDIVLLDIRMPGMDGIEAAQHLLQMEPPPAVIFCTAYDEYALDAFEVNAVGYVLKPVRRERLLRSLQHAKRLTESQLAAIVPETSTRTHISARTRLGLEVIPVDSISHFMADQKYVTAFFDGREVVVEDPLKSLEQEFPDRLLRIHRNCLVALSAIEGLQANRGGGQLKLRGVADTVAVSRRHMSSVKKALSRL